MAPQTASPLEQLPPPAAIHERIGQLARELAFLRRLMRLSQAVRRERPAGAEPRVLAPG